MSLGLILFGCVGGLAFKFADEVIESKVYLVCKGSFGWYHIINRLNNLNFSETQINFTFMYTKPN